MQCVQLARLSDGSRAWEAGVCETALKLLYAAEAFERLPRQVQLQHDLAAVLERDAEDGADAHSEEAEVGRRRSEVPFAEPRDLGQNPAGVAVAEQRLREHSAERI
jgi:hypothetical protein